MGCDIHMYVEYKKDLPIKGTKEREEKWINGDYFKYNPFFKTWEDEEEFSRLELHGSRNYQLFSTLAGVRDYSQKVVPVSEPKGVPDDACEYVKKESEQWGSDGHSHSWLTLKELKDYQSASPKMHYTGLLSPQDLVAFDTEGKAPNSWCQGTNQVGFERREWSQENSTLTPLIDKLQKRVHELLQYDYQDYDTSNDEKVRIVFWFDN